MIRRIERNRAVAAALIAATFLFSYFVKINYSIPLFLVCVYVYTAFRSRDLKISRFSHPALLFLIHTAAGSIILTQGISVAYVPFAVIPMLSSILFSNMEITLLLTLAGSICAGSFSAAPFKISLMGMISGLCAGFIAADARKRDTIFKAGVIAGCAQALTFFFLELSPSGGASSARIDTCGALVFNGILSGVIVLGTLPVFEFLFKTATKISLLELADFNHPLLQRLIMEAPGTYHHSLLVGNISEAACQAIGANALLARVGAYYHDIGKIQKADYFSENQNLRESRHDALTPSISRLVIMHHVKEGVDLARKYRLNPALVEFISRHHGNSLVYYFYQRAIVNSEEEKQVEEEVFRYPGPRPNTKETAVVLLADSVEAAGRALKEPTAANITDMVHKIINNKFIDGQLDECDLTLKDLNKIAAVFIRLLTSMYHSRVSYPAA